MKLFFAVCGLVFLPALLLGGCASAPKELKSPCVGAEGSPCGPKRSANPDIYKV